VRGTYGLSADIVVRIFLIIFTIGCFAVADVAMSQNPTANYRSAPVGHSFAQQPPQAVVPQPPTDWVGEPPVFTSGPSGLPAIRLDTDLSERMLDFQNRQSDKQLELLKGNQSIDRPEIILGAQFRGSGLVAHTNATSKFSYLGRFPTDFTGDSATDLRLLQANQSVVANVTPWATGYVETLFSDVFTFPDFKQGSFQVRQAYVVLGDLDAFPIYGFIGKKNVSFGDFSTLSPFTQAVPWHYFAPLAEGAGVGFSSNGLNATVTALNGSRGIRVVDSSNKGKVNNFAANIDYEIPLGPHSSVAIGGGYLHGTIHDQAVAEHLNPGLFGPMNPAWDVNARATFGPVQIAGEYVQTVDPWPATGHIVQAFRTETAVRLHDFGLPMMFSGSWSSGIQGDSNDEFEFNNQLVIGSRWDAHENMYFTFEYVRSLGFAPLINIQTVSDKSVRQNSFVFGCVLVI